MTEDGDVLVHSSVTDGDMCTKYTVMNAHYFYEDPDPAFQFDVELDSAIHFDTDPDSFCFKEAMYLKQ